MTRRFDRFLLLSTAMGSVVLLNLLSADHFLRFDLTNDRVFTLSEASRSTMESLEDQLSITAYFSGDLPPTFESQKRAVRDLLEEYHAASRGLLSFEFIDPHEQETEEDRAKRREVKRDIFGRRVREQTSIESELQGLGIRPVEIRVIEDDSAQTKLAYLGMVIRYQEEREVIPVVQGVAGLEYDLSTMIRRLVRTRIPVFGVLQGHGEADLESELSQLRQLLAQSYDVRPVILTEGDAIDDEVDALLIAGTREPYAEAELRAIDQFLMQGKSAAFLLDRVQVDLQTFQPNPVDHGFDDLLRSYGVVIGTDLVADAECVSLNVAERRGLFTVQMPVKYPFIPQPHFLAGDSALTRDVTDIALPFVSSISMSEIEGVEASALVRSSTRSWLEAPEPWRLDPRRDWRRQDVTVSGPYDLAVKASGFFPSHFASAEEVGQSTEDGLLSQSLAESRIMAVGTSAIVRNEFLGTGSASLMLNVVDWMLLDPALLEMRVRGSSEAPIQPELSPTSMASVKYGNAIGVPVLLGLYGLLRRMGRERRRALLARASEVSK
jgi:gliding-associated putative ABC transporter substrate-binding component GldG